jgi:hypothetical protein
MNYQRFMARDTTDFDPSDLAYITRMAALGDSYSAGIGAGDRLGTILQALDPKSGRSLSP